jgi:hypothetical protein
MVAVCGERFKWGGEVPVKKWIVGLLRQKKTCFERYLGNGRQTILVVYFGNSHRVKEGRAFRNFFCQLNWSEKSTSTQFTHISTQIRLKKISHSILI